MALAQSLKTGKRKSQDLSPDLSASTAPILSYSAFSFSADKGRLARLPLFASRASSFLKIMATGVFHVFGGEIGSGFLIHSGWDIWS